jgi:hypothetical protein
MTPAPVLEQEAPRAIDNNEDHVSLQSRIIPNRDKTRYVVCLGNHLEDDDLNSFKVIGAHMGGLWVSPSEVAGAPTMRRTNYFCYRGGLTPIESRPVPKKADHKARERQDETFMTGDGVPPGTRAYMVYAGDTMSFLLSDAWKPMGLVEVSALKYIPWKESHALDIQRHFFPQWDRWLRGAPSPELLNEWEDMVRDAVSRGQGNRVIESIGSSMIESGRVFRRYANNHIEQNRQRILSQRSIDSGGFYVGWNNRSRNYARQLNISLENEDHLRPVQTYQIPTAGDPELMKTMQQQMSQNQEMIKLLATLVKEKLGDEALGKYVEEFSATQAPQEVVEEETPDVSLGTIDDELEEEVELTEAVRTSDPERAAQLASQDRNSLERAIDRDPGFADAVESDPDLRAQLNDHPTLAGVIEDED